jgi:hypothetical protein
MLSAPFLDFRRQKTGMRLRIPCHLSLTTFEANWRNEPAVTSSQPHQVLTSKPEDDRRQDDHYNSHQDR